MKLFDLDKNGSIIPSAETLSAPLLNKIWMRDKEKNKAQALKELTFIYLSEDNQSPYSNFPEDKKNEMIINDLFKKNWKPDKELQEAISFYKQAIQTHSMRLLNAARVACDNLSDYFHGVNFTDTDEEGRPLYTAKDVAANLAAVGKIIESLDVVEDKIKREISSKIKVRGGGTISDRER